MIKFLKLSWASFSPRAPVPAASGQADHYLGLDFLRGLAALAVTWFHMSSRLDLPLLFRHGYLAVDFFFVLSGFVIARAYQARIASRRLPILRFALMRAIRLMPLIILGTLVAAIVEIGRPGITDQHQHLIDTSQALLFSLFLVPTLWPTTLELAVFPLNGPTWSLFLEIIANAAFAVWALTCLGLRALVLLLGISALSLIWGAYLYGEIGFGALPGNFWLGFARVGWSFVTGMILFHVRDRAPQLPFAVPALLLVVILLMPRLSTLSGAFDALCVLFVLPWIVWTASSARFGAVGRRWSAWSGDLSYPIYALHYPLIRVFGVVVTTLHLPLFERLGIAILATLVILLVSALAYVLFDVPIRRRLMSQLTLRSSQLNSTLSSS